VPNWDLTRAHSSNLGCTLPEQIDANITANWFGPELAYWVRAVRVEPVGLTEQSTPPRDPVGPVAIAAELQEARKWPTSK
jgi:hypothetical protein